MIEKLFTSKSRVKVLGYLFFGNNKGSIRGISRGLGVAPSVVKREVDNLEEIGLVRKVDGGIILNEECNFLGDLKNILIKTDYVVEPIKVSLEKLKLDFVVLYGSYVKGNFKKESDLDLLVVGDEKPEKVYSEVEKLEEKLGKDINVNVWTLRDLKKKKNGFLRDLNKNKIMIRGNKNEFEKIIG